MPDLCFVRREHFTTSIPSCKKRVANWSQIVPGDEGRKKDWGRPRGSPRATRGKVLMFSKQNWWFRKDGLIRIWIAEITRLILHRHCHWTSTFLHGGNFQMKWAKKWVLIVAHHIFITFLWKCDEVRENEFDIIWAQLYLGNIFLILLCLHFHHKMYLDKF